MVTVLKKKMFKLIANTKSFDYLLKTVIVLLTFCAVFTYLSQSILSEKKISLNKINVEYLSVWNVVYLSILFVLLLISIINRQVIKNAKQTIVIFITFAIIIYFIVYTDSMFTFFLSYELLLILTAVVVYYNSQNIRSKSITVYFIFWTQLSSFILWLAVAYIYSNTGTYRFSQLSSLFCDRTTKNLVKWLLIVSFGIKLPLWPFSFWLIKTHVESNTSFSIFLSGVLVKTALIGLIKFNVFFTDTDCTLIVVLVILSILFTTLSLHTQVDFKKLIAYTTVQEMSLIVLFTFFNNYTNLNLLIYFILLHTFTSLLLFMLNDSIYIRFKTRKTKLFLGIATVAPKLNLILLLSWVFFISIPVSFKFILEVALIWKFFNLPYLLLVSLLMCLQFLTLVFFTVNTMPYSFGSGLKLTKDISKNEIFIFSITFVVLIALIF